MRSYKSSALGLVLGACAAMPLTHQAQAFEPGASSQEGPGVTTGVPNGAAPPPGLYGALLTSWGSGTVPQPAPFAHASAMVDVAALLYNPNWHILGGTFLVAMAQPFIYADLWTAYGGANGFQHIDGLHNTDFAPAILSWNLGQGFFFSTALDFYAPDGAISGPTGLDRPGSPYWTIQPGAALSYYANGYDLSAHAMWGINTRNTYSQVTDGQVLNVDLTATKRFGKWELGPVGYIVAQVTNDRNCAPGLCSRYQQDAIGALVRYDWGPANLAITGFKSIVEQNAADEWRVWATLAFRIWGPEPPPSKPLITKN